MISPDIPEDMKKCAGPCGLVLELEAFYRHPNCHKGRQPTCKKCTAAAAKAKKDANKPAEPVPSPAPVAPSLIPAGTGVLISGKDVRYVSDEDFLILAQGNEQERRAALAAIMARAATARPAGIAAAARAPSAQEETRLELATAILDRIANGSRERLPQACAQAAQFVMIERGAQRYIRKPKEL